MTDSLERDGQHNVATTEIMFLGASEVFDELLDKEANPAFTRLLANTGKAQESFFIGPVFGSTRESPFRYAVYIDWNSKKDRDECLASHNFTHEVARPILQRSLRGEVLAYHVPLNACDPTEDAGLPWRPALSAFRKLYTRTTVIRMCDNLEESQELVENALRQTANEKSAAGGLFFWGRANAKWLDIHAEQYRSFRDRSTDRVQYALVEGADTVEALGEPPVPEDTRVVSTFIANLREISEIS